MRVTRSSQNTQMVLISKDLQLLETNMSVGSMSTEVQFNTVYDT